MRFTHTPATSIAATHRRRCTADDARLSDIAVCVFTQRTEKDDDDNCYEEWHTLNTLFVRASNTLPGYEANATVAAAAEALDIFLTHRHTSSTTPTHTHSHTHTPNKVFGKMYTAQLNWSPPAASARRCFGFSVRRDTAALVLVWCVLWMRSARQRVRVSETRMCECAYRWWLVRSRNMHKSCVRRLQTRRDKGLLDDFCIIVFRHFRTIFAINSVSAEVSADYIN